jgi:hypothetical protein
LTAGRGFSPTIVEARDSVSGVFSERFAGLQERFRKQLGIQEVFIGLASQVNEAREIRKLLYHDGVGHLKREQEPVRGLANHSFQVLSAGKIVIGRVDADRFEDLRIFGKAVRLNRVSANLPRYAYRAGS